MKPAGPVDPQMIAPSLKLPPAPTWEAMRRRFVAKLRHRLSKDDFDHTFEHVVSWLDGRVMDCQQARDSAFDVAVAMCGFAPAVIVQKGEKTGVVLMTMIVRPQDGSAKLQRTCEIDILDPATAEPPAGAVSFAAKLGRKRA